MSDALTSAEREAIAAYPEDRVQRIPTGVSGEALYCWDGKDLVAERPRRWKPLYRKRKSPVRGRDPKVQERRERVAELRAAGLNLRQIAETIGAPYETVKFDIREMRKVA